MGNIYGNQPEEVSEVNVWKAIWSRPRKAMRTAINQNKMQLAMLLTIVTGIVNSLDRAINEELGEKMPFLLILVTAIIVGALGAFIGWWILSGLTTWIGKWFGGKGTYKEMKIVVGISNIPIALAGVLYIFDILFLGQSLFMDVDISIMQFFWVLFSASVGFVASGWSLFLLIKGIAEAHRFSSWKALFTVLIPIVFVVLFILLLALLFVLLAI